MVSERSLFEFKVLAFGVSGQQAFLQAFFAVVLS